jgi:predicted type IV restriction endonuclease
MPEDVKAAMEREQMMLFEEAKDKEEAKAEEEAKAREQAEGREEASAKQQNLLSVAGGFVDEEG